MNEILKRGMVILVNLDPTIGSETGKTRPCAIVTNNTYNLRVPVIQVIPITNWTERKAKILTNITIEPNSKNGLTKRSIADCLQTRPIDKSKRVLNVLGQLSMVEMNEIDKALKIVFELSN